MNIHFNKNLSTILWDIWCTISIVGIWPRFIEPRLLLKTVIPLKIPHLPPDLSGLKILHLSDLHFHQKISKRFLKKIISKIHDLKPDLIFFTGDFICYSTLENPKELKQFLEAFQAKYGCFAVLGNHDYEQFISLNPEGFYDVVEMKESSIVKGLKRIFSTIEVKKKGTANIEKVKCNENLLNLLKETPIRVLENETQQIPIGKTFLNICGLGEYMAGRLNPIKAFANYKTEFPGIILAHNPDAADKLADYPGELILSGHTHGGQVNLPFLIKRFHLMENPDLKKGLHQIKENKVLYINRGIGSPIPFRWLAPPELTLFILNKEKP